MLLRHSRTIKLDSKCVYHEVTLWFSLKITIYVNIVILRLITIFPTDRKVTMRTITKFKTEYFFIAEFLPPQKKKKEVSKVAHFLTKPGKLYDKIVLDSNSQRNMSRESKRQTIRLSGRAVT
jgi:hypothetical protein